MALNLIWYSLVEAWACLRREEELVVHPARSALIGPRSFRSEPSLITLHFIRAKGCLRKYEAWRVKKRRIRDRPVRFSPPRDLLIKGHESAGPSGGAACHVARHQTVLQIFLEFCEGVCSRISHCRQSIAHSGTE